MFPYINNCRAVLQTHISLSRKLKLYTALRTDGQQWGKPLRVNNWTGGRRGNLHCCFVAVCHYSPCAQESDTHKIWHCTRAATECNSTKSCRLFLIQPSSFSTASLHTLAHLCFLQHTDTLDRHLTVLVFECGCTEQHTYLHVSSSFSKPGEPELCYYSYYGD